MDPVTSPPHATETPGGVRELMRLALPLILSASFWNLQIFIDRVLLSQYSAPTVGAAMASVLIFYAPFALLQYTALYATTFVAQYLGAGRPQRVGPAVWQSLYFGTLTGIAFMALWPLAEPIIAWGGHDPELQILEVSYFRCLCFSALPALLVASVSSFFVGRGDNWTVMFLNAIGLVVNALLDYAWISGNWGFPEWGIAGAGWATVIGNWVSAFVGLGLMFRPTFCQTYGLLSGWHYDRELFQRMMRYGLPSGFQVTLDVLAFTIFTLLVGRMGALELAATSVAFTINMVAILPMLGTAQAVNALVGRRLGENRPDLAARSTWSGAIVTLLFMTPVAIIYLVFPNWLLMFFESTKPEDLDSWVEVAILVPLLLRFVALYSLFDGLNLIFSFALKGAGDTRFVTLVVLLLPWPMMVLPTWLALVRNWSLLWPWTFASAYIITLAVIFLARFLGGRWKTMRVIEMAEKPPLEEGQALETSPGAEPLGESVPVG